MAETKKELTFDINEFIYIDSKYTKNAILKWIAKRQAQKRYSKPIDAVLIKENKIYDYNASKIIHDLIKNQELDSELFYKTEQKLSYNDGQVDNAEAIWTIDVDTDEPIINLADAIYSKTIFKNRVIEVEIFVQKFTSDTKKEFAVIEKRNKNEISRKVGTLSDGKFTEIPESDFNDLPDDIKEQLNEISLETIKWTGTFEPFVYLKNDIDAKSDKDLIETELNDLVSLIQKKRDDIHLSSVKVEAVGLQNANEQKQKGNSQSSAEAIYKQMISTGVLLRDQTGLEGQPAATIVNAVPNTDVYDRAIRTTINTILKKTGGATDVDSKGTVQQSKGEVLMSQGDEYKVSNWKKTNRQNKIKELIEKIVLTYKEQLGNKKAFADTKYIFAFISQEEVLSEREQLENAKLAKDLGITSELLIKARYHNMTILEMYEYDNLQFDLPIGESNE